MSLASAALQQNNALTAANTAAASKSTAAAQTSSAARASLAGNFDNFLKLLMTQLKNQDPTSPLDTNQFTSQLVQFASVEQQINANSNLAQLIELTQGQQVLQAASLVGKRVLIQADHLPLQDGKGTIQFSAASDKPVAIAISTDSGLPVRSAVLPGQAGANQWIWDGTNDAGARVPDGSYRVAVIGANPDGTTTTQKFLVQGLTTGITRQDNSVRLQMGAQTVDLAAIQQVLP